MSAVCADVCFRPVPIRSDVPEVVPRVTPPQLIPSLCQHDGGFFHFAFSPLVTEVVGGKKKQPCHKLHCGKLKTAALFSVQSFQTADLNCRGKDNLTQLLGSISVNLKFTAALQFQVSHSTQLHKLVQRMLVLLSWRPLL